ncbi:MAG: 3-hydroxyacyl-CoA dehydrogenase NAD-binding domain-containing protein [Solirubrobacteraceae bacterium]|nr:3-hydroxyacyl-CoA dehydrogenase NAD-binding domain-containing protein [Solirubrobacteraceae bacterium]
MASTPTAAVPDVIAVIGAGTMGAGIAQLAAQAGARTLLHDPVPEALERGVAGIGKVLDRLAAKGKITAEDAAAIRGRIEPAATLTDLAGAGMVIEAAPERLQIKLDLFNELAGILDDDAILATNTSSLSVTEIAASTPNASRVVGLHFFNPAPVMRLVEVVAGEHTSDRAVAIARAVGEAMGKHVVDAADVAGFLVNRVNRPYSLEALKLLQEQIATVEQIDRICRQAARFRMGPFELMDLIGIETNHAVAESFHRQSYGEPRYQPSPLAARKIAAGTLGRKTGSGWYAYAEGAAHRPDDVDPPATGGGNDRTIAIVGDLPVAAELRTAAGDAGFTVGDDDAWLVLDLRTDDDAPLPAGPRAVSLHRGSLHAIAPTAAGFHALAPLAAAQLIETTTTATTDPDAIERLTAFIAAIGRHPEPVADAPGLVAGRIVAQLINEAAFLIGEGNGTPEDVDAGLRLGVNHPQGPVAWADRLGVAHVVAILDALHRELGEPRYRVAPLLRRRLAVGGGLA